MNSMWSRTIRTSADPRQARHFYSLLAAADPDRALERVTVEQARILAALFSGSEAMSSLLVATPGWISCLSPQNLGSPSSKQGLWAEAHDGLKPLLKSRNWPAALGRLREFKQRETLRITARDL